MRVRVRGIQRGVAGLAEGSVVAVGAVNRIQEVVQEPVKCVMVLIVRVIGLEENRILRPDDRVRDLEVKIRLWSGISNAGGRFGTVDSLQLRVCASRNSSGMVSAFIDLARQTYGCRVRKNSFRSCWL